MRTVSGGHADGFGCRLVSCRLDELQPHPSYARHRLEVSSSQLSRLAAHGDLAFRDPIVITRDRKIIDGYARLDFARRRGRAEILCIEHDISEEESLRRFIETHLPCRGLNAYCRIIFALDVEQVLKDRAQANQQAGGRDKGSSNLTEAKNLDVRSEIAAIAHVSTGNVTKVKQLRKTASAEVNHAVRTGEISIHKAWQWSYESPEQQSENLRLRRIERGIKRKARALVAEHQAKLLSPPTKMASVTVSEFFNRLSSMYAENSTGVGTVKILVLDVPGKGIYLAQDVAKFFEPPQEGLA